MLKMLQTVAIAALLFVFPVNSFAWVYNTCVCTFDEENLDWESFPVEFNFDATYFTDNPGSEDVTNALHHWDIVRNQGWWYTTDDSVNCAFHTSDNVNCIDYGNSEQIPGTNAAYTWWWSYESCSWGYVENCEIDEADIGFDFYANITNGPPNPYEPENTDYMRALALHEIGHSMGLEHQVGRVATMDPARHHGGFYPSSTSYDEGLALPHPDDREGVRDLYYSSQGGETDVAVMNFKWDATDSRQEVTAPLSPEYACPGDDVSLEYGRSNLGTSAVNFHTGWYMSTNPTITTSDTLLESSTTSSAPLGHQTYYTRYLTIPANVSYGATYYFGAYVDYDAQLTESWEGNNKVPARGSVTIKSQALCQ